MCRYLGDDSGQRTNIYGGLETVGCLELVNERKEARVASAWRVRGQTDPRCRQKTNLA